MAFRKAMRRASRSWSTPRPDRAATLTSCGGALEQPADGLYAQRRSCAMRRSMASRCAWSISTLPDGTALEPGLTQRERILILSSARRAFSSPRLRRFASRISFDACLGSSLAGRDRRVSARDPPYYSDYSKLPDRGPEQGPPYVRSLNTPLLPIPLALPRNRNRVYPISVTLMSGRSRKHPTSAGGGNTHVRVAPPILRHREELM